MEDAKNYITEVLVGAGVKEVEFEIGEYKEATWRDDNSTFMSYDGYINHAGELEDFVDFILSNPNMLLSYLFNNDSIVATGNDNSEGYPEVNEHARWIYHKGN